ncbi:MAG: CusA/CzcA family heavy metal efflux RND transporter [endosymbiont of Galathealinum brachiosum]|uniref:CusA/CzcA family heavy metal efflux RND transporter n=1 Tax=endosymbiont of Galathealinum brachiosum TaxID=2200906 RepID=A0A370DKU1_9GAMM|nr:MAG: CusA/CzcA family heavy metal efflux RND transporter [endosymbiont of Galathealinum brachiosum]
MIEALIRWSVNNRAMVLVLAAMMTIGGIYVTSKLSLDAVPDLSDVQVIIRATHQGQAPQAIEDQITYPLATAMLAAPGARTVRAYSFTGDAYIYVIFEDGTDPYWARSRVLEALNEIRERLPSDAKIVLGPDASGVGWIYQYALVDRSGAHDLADLRAIQDWFLRYELTSIAGVAEVATIGGMEKQYEVQLDPVRMEREDISYHEFRHAISDAAQEVSGSMIEIAEAEYLVRGKGYLRSIEDIQKVPILKRWDFSAVPRVGDLADVVEVPRTRRGMAELDGEGEVVGGIVVMRYGENALSTIERVEQRLAELSQGLPEGVEIVETYNRSKLINRAVDTLSFRLIEEFIVVILVCAVFLLHMRSSLIIVVSLPLGILAAFVVMSLQGITANIMSLGGIAIAIGAMVDATIVMIENVHKRMEGREVTADSPVLIDALVEVGRPLFISLIIITVSFVPIFALEAQEGRLFAPLAFTKSYAMAAAAGISITLVPALVAYLIRGNIKSETDNRLNRGLMSAYRPVIDYSLKHPKTILGIAFFIVVSALLPWRNLGVEFMPSLNEGSLLYMPSTMPGLSAGKAAELLQQTDRMIKTVPEVRQVFGKIGRANTATDPAPLTMIETTIRLKPEEDWREGMTLSGIRDELDKAVNVPGLTNTWLMPISARIDMLATGIRTPVGIKVAGPDLKVIEKLGQKIEKVVSGIPGTKSAFAERVDSARYIDIEMNPESAALYGVSVGQVQEVVRTAIGGEDVAYTIEGRERHPVRMRMAPRFRESLSRIKQIPVDTKRERVPIGDIANIIIRDGPAMIKSENARLNGWTYIDIGDIDIGTWLKSARKIVAEQVEIPPGYSLKWSGQYEYLSRVEEKLSVIVPLTLGLILILLYINFRNMTEALMVMSLLPVALVGGIWLVWVLDYNLSVAVAVGFIAVAGVAAEFGVVMLVYLDGAVKRLQPQTSEALNEAIMEGALQRLRPKAMTATVIVAGLVPILIGTGTGSEVMSRIAAPMVGGMITAPLVSMVFLPVVYGYWQKKQLQIK